MECDELVYNYPELYHVTARGAWTSIKKHGLLTTNELLEMPGATRSLPTKGRWGRLDDPTDWKPMGRNDRGGSSRAVRHDCVRVSDPESCMTAVIRDQEPLGKGTALEGQLSHQTPLRPSTPTMIDWLYRQNDRVFFFPTKEGALVMAEKYHGKGAPQDMIVVCTNSLVNALGHKIELSAYNSGNTRREGENVVTKNGKEKWHDELFLPIRDYDYRKWRRKRRKGKTEPVSEVTVVGGVCKIANHVVKVLPMNGAVEGEPFYEGRCHVCPSDRDAPCSESQRLIEYCFLS